MARAKPTKPSVPTATFEKLGAFYLGRMYDQARDVVSPDYLLYDSKDLTTHAVCVGMTGSGKTGLCISLLEEAAIDGIPTIAIDPKGDLGNILLTFPDLRPDDFRPWIDEAAAARKGATVSGYAETVARIWRDGLAEWGQGGERIALLRDSADLAIYTPGSTAGVPLRLLKSFAPPPPELVANTEAFNERIAASASGLLALVGVAADPIRSREHILIANLLDKAWREGRELELPDLILQVQRPPFDKIGVLDLETFFPERERFELAMTLNNLLASPGFAAWLEGEPLDIRRLLWTDEGKPRVSIISIAHLTESERMFLVTAVLNELIAWMRQQTGTASLRALLYMDEVFGYLPPTANPPSKVPMLTLLKQARAYGLGLVLATQNPVDLDYKALSNTGTWFLGRLQTERDMARVLDGLEGASTSAGASFDRRATEQTLAGLKSRVFLMNNVHEERPALFHTRWAMSYLRGPLTRAQIQALTAERRAAAPARPAAPTPSTPAPSTSRDGALTDERPVVPDVVPQFVMHGGDHATGAPVYRPAVLGTADLHFVDARAGVDEWDTVSYVAPLEGKATGDIWERAERVRDEDVAPADQAVNGASYHELPARARDPKSFATWQKSFKTHLYKDRQITVREVPALELVSRPDESEADFIARVRHAAREHRDMAVEKLREAYASKLNRLRDQVERAQQKVESEKAQYGQQKMHAAISMGATVLGALLGRKATSVGTVGKAATTMRGMSRAAREKEDVARAAERLDVLQQELAKLEEEFRKASEDLDDPADPSSFKMKEIVIRPRKSDIAIGQFGLAWIASAR